MLFRLNEHKLSRIKEENITANYLERDIQRLTEDNLETIFGLKFVTTEFQIDNLRIDSLAFDEENKSFVIIEYKKTQNYSVIDQGFTYVSLLLNRKADFVLKYNQVFGQSFGVSDIDWSQSKVVFVSPSFSSYQVQANSFKDLPMELYEFNKYGDIVEYKQLKSMTTKNSIKDFKTSTDGNVKKISEEIKIYSEDYHLNNKSERIIELYEVLRNRILTINENIQIDPKKTYIAFKYNGRNFTDIVVIKSKIVVYLNIKSGYFRDDGDILRDVIDINHWGNGDYEIAVDNDENIERVMDLIKQSYNYNFKVTGGDK